MKRVTAASMVFTNGTITVYGIYCMRLHEGKKPWFDLNDPRTVELDKVTRTDKPGFYYPELAQYYLELARPYATPEAPAFSFGLPPAHMEPPCQASA